MNEFVTQRCDEQDGKFIVARLNEFNKSKLDPLLEPDVIHINRKITDENGDIIAAISGSVYLWNGMSIDMFWIHEDYRKKGIGTNLLGQVENEARNKGCSFVHLDTFDFQAKDFCIKNGYEVFGVLDGYPDGHKRYSLKKAL